MQSEPSLRQQRLKKVADGIIALVPFSTRLLPCQLFLLPQLWALRLLTAGHVKNVDYPDLAMTTQQQQLVKPSSRIGF